MSVMAEPFHRAGIFPYRQRVSNNDDAALSHRATALHDSHIETTDEGAGAGIFGLLRLDLPVSAQRPKDSSLHNYGMIAESVWGSFRGEERENFSMR